MEEQIENKDEVKVKRKSSSVAKRFNQQWPLTLTPGRILYFNGKIRKSAAKFYLNLACGIGCVRDLALHLAVHFHYNKIIRNSRINGFWGDEECSSIRRFPFHRNKPFSMQILCTENEFLVAVNAKHTCSFAYRIPVTFVEVLHMAGDIALENLHERKCNLYPMSIDPEIPHCIILGAGAKVDNVGVSDIKYTPILVSLPDGFHKNNRLIIFGALKLKPYSFYVSLQTETCIWPASEILLQAKIVIKANEIYLICNSFLEGKWGNEEVTAINMVRPGHCFVLRIDCNEDHYAIIINKISVIKFKYRQSPDTVSGLLFQGDVYIDVLRLK